VAWGQQPQRRRSQLRSKRSLCDLEGRVGVASFSEDVTG